MVDSEAQIQQNVFQREVEHIFDMRDVYYTEQLPTSSNPSPGMEFVGENSSDSVEVPLDPSQLPVGLQTATIVNGDFGMVNGNEYQPRIVIVEEPQQRGFRFRYECEGPSHGGLQGDKSQKSRKTHPSIKIENYSGPAKIVVSLVTDEEVPRHHAHKLVGKNCQNGVCVVQVQSCSGVVPFPNMCILHVTRKKATEVLKGRILDSLRQERQLQKHDLNSTVAITKDDVDRAAKQAQDQAKHMSLNVVRLCFQAYLMDDDNQYTRIIESAISRPIYDSKSPGASALKICRMDKYGGCCTGNEEVFLLCEKVQKDDISVRFVEFSNDDEKKVVWEGYGNFSPLDVHRQYAIVFRTPAYRNTLIDKAVNVMIMLQRKSDGEMSEGKAFTYYPRNLDKDGIARKKRKTISSFGNFDNNYFGSGAGGFGGGGFGGPDGGGGGSSFRVILPNGNTVQQHGNVPAIVEPAIQECFDSPSSSPYRTDVDVLDYPYDLSTDSEPITTSDLSRISTYRGKGKHGTIKEVCIDDATAKMADMKLVGSRPQDVSDKGSEETRENDTKDSNSDGKDSSSETSGSVPPTEGARTDEGFSESSSIPGDVSPKKTGDSKDKDTLKKGKEIPDKKAVKEILQSKDEEAVRIAKRTAIALRDYAETGDIRYLLLIQRHLASIQNENGDLPIHLAVINQQMIALQYLLDVMGTLHNSRLRVNTVNHLRQTALHIAVITNQKNVVEILLHSGADPMISDRNGNVPAHLAILYDQLECLKSLIRYIHPSTSLTKPFPELDFLNFEGYAPAHIAARYGNVEMLKVLMHGQADMNLQDGKSGRTPLHHAVEVDDLPTAGYLLMEADVNVNARCFDGNTALHIASGRGLVAMVALLMTASADPDVENEEVPPLVEGEAGEDSGTESFERRGMIPADYAQDHERILEILQGHIYEPESLAASFDDLDLQVDSMPAEGPVTTDGNTESSHIESGVHSISTYEQGDVDKLDFLARIELGKLLDPESDGRDVFSLAKKLDFYNLQNALKSMRGESSPTRFLLDYYEASDGTIKHLRNSLIGISRHDAVSIVDAAVQGHTQKPGDLKPGEKLMSEPQVDSGVHSMGGKTLSATHLPSS